MTVITTHQDIVDPGATSMLGLVVMEKEDLNNLNKQINKA
jgi:hypothetical protein